VTYCLAIKVKEGVVALADGRITAGTQVTSARKTAMFGDKATEIVIMTSGLRSLRDKTLAYLRRAMQERGSPHGSMFEAVMEYSKCLRIVAEEEHDALARGNLYFNLYAIVAGQLPLDSEPTIYLVYPEGSWLEVDTRTPYVSIGETTYGKPILDRALSYGTSLRNAVKLAYLSFDSTRISAADVGYPIDILTYGRADRRWREAHFDYDDMIHQRQWWNSNLMELASKMPDDLWSEALIGGNPLSVVNTDKK